MQSVTLSINDVDESPQITSDELAFALQDGGSDQAVYTAVSNIDGATFSLVDNTVYPVVNSGSDPVSTTTFEPPQLASTQQVYISQSTVSEDGTQVELIVSYSADVAGTTGVGFNVEFDDSQLALSNIEMITVSDNIAGGSESSDNGTTSLTFAYASLFGSFPGSTPVELAKITLDIVGSTPANIAISEVSSSAIHSFVGHAHTIEEIAGSDPETMASQLSIDSATGVVTLSGDADYDVVPNYNFTVTASNGSETAEQTVALAVIDHLVSSGEDNFTGTDGADVFALANGAGEVISGAGEDIFALVSKLELNSANMTHKLIDFESGVDSIDLSVALALAGYTAEDSATQLIAANMTADINDLIADNDNSLDNMYGGMFDDTNNLLTIFADTNSYAGSVVVESYQIELGENSSVEDDDITAVSFIA